MTKRIIEGLLPTGNYGDMVSEPGYDVRTSPVDNERIWFSTDWPEAIPILQAGSVTLAPNASTTITFPALGYKPFVMLFAKSVPITRAGVARSGEAMSLNSSATSSYMLPYAEVSDGSFFLNNDQAGYTLTFSYFVLLVQAA